MRRIAFVLLIGLLVGLIIGWWARWYVDSDSCLDAGGRWESRGGYCIDAQFGPKE